MSTHRASGASDRIVELLLQSGQVLNALLYTRCVMDICCMPIAHVHVNCRCMHSDGAPYSLLRPQLHPAAYCAPYPTGTQAT